jgi:hypothetical protein
MQCPQDFFGWQPASEVSSGIYRLSQAQGESAEAVRADVAEQVVCC